MRPVLFLDFDGTLHSLHIGQRDFRHLPLLEAWLRKRPSVEVVLSTQWRETTAFDELVAKFSPDLRPRIVGVTRSYDDIVQTGGPASAFRRHIEIEHWLRDHGSPVHAVLDDDASLFPPHATRLVICDGLVGLTPAKVEALDALLFGAESQGPADEASRLSRLPVRELASVVMGPSRANEWWTTPTPWLNGAAPAELASSPEGAEKVRDYLGRVHFGVET